VACTTRDVRQAGGFESFRAKRQQVAAREPNLRLTFFNGDNEPLQSLIFYLICNVRTDAYNPEISGSSSAVAIFSELDLATSYFCFVRRL
jgi:hypothetical protein